MIIKLAPQDIRRYNWYIWRTVIGCFAFFVLLLVSNIFWFIWPAAIISATWKTQKVTRHLR